MKKISLWCLLLAFTISLAHAQESATQQQIDKLSGQIQDILDAQALQGKRLDAIEKEISDLRDKVNTPAAMPDCASRDDLKKLAVQVQEIDRKREEDRDLILEQIKKLAAAAGNTTPVVHHSHSTPDNTTAPATPEKGYEHEIQPGENLGMIIKACHEKGIKVTLQQIKEANPNLNPDLLIPGKKIFIPDPNAK